MDATVALLFFSLMWVSQAQSSDPDAAARESVWLGRFEATQGTSGADGVAQCVHRTRQNDRRADGQCAKRPMGMGAT
jgi:hypothetical protein